MKILIDMNLSPRWVQRLEQSGIIAVHWSTLGAGDAQDIELMTFARNHDYVVLTHDLDFSAILAATQSKKPSVVQIRSDAVDSEYIEDSIIVALGEMAKELEKGALLTIDLKRKRLRLLPIHTRSDFPALIGNLHG